MHPKGPVFSSVVWGSMRSEEQFDSADKLADFLRFLLDRGVTTLDTANTYGIPIVTRPRSFSAKPSSWSGRQVRDCHQMRHPAALAASQGKPHPPLRLQREGNPALGRPFARKLGIDQADAILLHRPDYLMDPEETAGALDALIAEGSRTKFVGVSNMSPSRIDLLASRLKAPIVIIRSILTALSQPDLQWHVRPRHPRRLPANDHWSPVGGGRLLTSDDAQARKLRDILTRIAKENGLDRPGRRQRWPSSHAIRRSPCRSS